MCSKIFASVVGHATTHAPPARSPRPTAFSACSSSIRLRATTAPSASTNVRWRPSFMTRRGPRVTGWDARSRRTDSPMLNAPCGNNDAQPAARHCGDTAMARGVAAPAIRALGCTARKIACWPSAISPPARARPHQARTRPPLSCRSPNHRPWRTDRARSWQ